jgi:enoyl-CoA hydratase/carnithine racemase
MNESTADLARGRFRDITLDIKAGIATIVLRRPEALNAFTRRMESDLVSAFDECDQDDRVRAIVLTGAGRAFCAGADLTEAGAIFEEWVTSSPEASAEPIRDGGGRVALRMYESLKPIVVAINGPAVGVGITMTLAADIRIAADDARMGFVFTRRGLAPESCSSWFLPRIVPIQQALEWVLTGRVFDASEALRGGLVRSIHPAAELLRVARNLAEQMSAETAPVSIALSRQLLWSMLGEPHPMSAHRAESRALLSRGTSADVREGVAAFLEKRPPDFKDRVNGDLLDVLGDLPRPTYRP